MAFNCGGGAQVRLVSDGFDREFFHRGKPEARDCIIWLHHGGGTGRDQLRVIRQRDSIIDVCPTALIGAASGATAWLKPDAATSSNWPVGADGDEDQIFLGEDLLNKVNNLYLGQISRWFLVGHSSGCAFIFSMISNGWGPSELTERFAGYFGIKHLPLHENVDEGATEFLIVDHFKPFGWWFSREDPIVDPEPQHPDYDETKFAVVGAYDASSPVVTVDDYRRGTVDITDYTSDTPLRIYESIDDPSHSMLYIDNHAIDFFRDHANLGA